MKINDFMKNPIGKGAVIPGRQQLLIALDYRMKVLQKNKDIKLNIYTHNKDAFYHFIIPSESPERECDYDIVLKFKHTHKNDDLTMSYIGYELEFFSNCPSFTYGYAYVANINGYLIKEFSNKYETKVLKYPPVSKNPGLTFGYEKSIYFACKYLTDNKQYLMKSHVNSHAKPLTNNIINSIRHMNKIEEQYKRADKKRREEKKRNRVKIDKKTQKKKEEFVNNRSNVNVVKKTKAKKPGVSKIQPIKKK